MPDTPDDAQLNQEFDVLARRAGLDIPADRRAALFAGFKDLRGMLALLRQPRDATHEPAATYALDTVTRSLGA